VGSHHKPTSGGSLRPGLAEHGSRIRCQQDLISSTTSAPRRGIPRWQADFKVRAGSGPSISIFNTARARSSSRQARPCRGARSVRGSYKKIDGRNRPITTDQAGVLFPLYGGLYRLSHAPASFEKRVGLGPRSAGAPCRRRYRAVPLTGIRPRRRRILHAGRSSFVPPQEGDKSTTRRTDADPRSEFATAALRAGSVALDRKCLRADGKRLAKSGAFLGPAHILCPGPGSTNIARANAPSKDVRFAMR